MLRNKDVTQLIADCDYNHNIIERPKYPNFWTRNPKFTYNSYNRIKCRDLEQQFLTHHPIKRKAQTINSFHYKTLKPLKSSTSPTYLIDINGTNGIKEYFNYHPNNNLIHIIIILLLVVYFATLN